MASIETELAPWPAPSFARIEVPPGNRQDGFKEAPAIPVADLPKASLQALADEWLTDLYNKAGQTPDWTFNE